MKPKQISYSESKESVDTFGLKSWRKAGVEIELDDTDSVEAAYDEAKIIIAKAMYPVTWTEIPYVSPSVDNRYNMMSPKEVSAALPSIDLEKEKTEIQIENCTSKEELESLMNVAFQHGLVNEFINKKKSLQ
jgi:hypothetical protein